MFLFKFNHQRLYGLPWSLQFKYTWKVSIVDLSQTVPSLSRPHTPCFFWLPHPVQFQFDLMCGAVLFSPPRRVLGTSCLCPMRLYRGSPSTHTHTNSSSRLSRERVAPIDATLPRPLVFGQPHLRDLKSVGSRWQANSSRGSRNNICSIEFVARLFGFISQSRCTQKYYLLFSVCIG